MFINWSIFCLFATPIRLKSTAILTPVAFKAITNDTNNSAEELSI